MLPWDAALELGSQYALGLLRPPCSMEPAPSLSLDCPFPAPALGPHMWAQSYLSDPAWL